MSLIYGPSAKRHPPTMAELMPLLEAACSAWREAPTFANKVAVFQACMDVATVIILFEEKLNADDMARTDRLLARLYGEQP